MNDPMNIFKNDWKYRNWFVTRRIIFFLLLFIDLYVDEFGNVAC